MPTQTKQGKSSKGGSAIPSLAVFKNEPNKVTVRYHSTRESLMPGMFDSAQESRFRGECVQEAAQISMGISIVATRQPVNCYGPGLKTAIRWAIFLAALWRRSRE